VNETELTERQRRLTRRIRLGMAAIWLVPIGIGLQLLLSGRLLPAAMVTSVGLIMFVMSIRAARYGSRFVEGGTNDGDVAPPYLDYLIMSIFGIPLLLFGFLAIALVFGD
jgi:hypothetical protein